MRKRKATRSEIIERNEKIVKDYENGLSFEELSEKYGLCVRTCYRALDEEQQAQRIAEEQDHANPVDKIVAEYQKNTAVRDIAEKYGVSIGYCSAIAVQAGISNKELSHRRITRRQQKRNDEIFERLRKTTKTGPGPLKSLRNTISPDNRSIISCAEALIIPRTKRISGQLYSSKNANAMLKSLRMSGQIRT